MKVVCLFGVALIAAGNCGAQLPPDEQTFAKISSSYQHVLAALDFEKTKIGAQYSRLPSKEDYFLHEKSGSIYTDIWMTIKGPVDLTFFRTPFKLRSIHNAVLDAYLKDKGAIRQTAPTLSIEQAFDKAKKFLDVLEYQLPGDYRLGEIRFDSAWRSCWEVRWWRVASGIYPQDRFDPVALEDVCVVFHETLGLHTFGFRNESPPPTSLEVKVSREEAILKATRAAPLVQRTPFYKESRSAGFVLKGVKEAGLQVAIPNWLLDPARAAYIRDTPPDETRLCWVVRFSTVNGNSEADGAPKLIAPDILIYIDAKTEEVVGAAFT